MSSDCSTELCLSVLDRAVCDVLRFGCKYWDTSQHTMAHLHIRFQLGIFFYILNRMLYSWTGHAHSHQWTKDDLLKTPIRMFLDIFLLVPSVGVFLVQWNQVFCLAQNDHVSSGNNLDFPFFFFFPC